MTKDLGTIDFERRLKSWTIFQIGILQLYLLHWIRETL